MAEQEGTPSDIAWERTNVIATNKETEPLLLR